MNCSMRDSVEDGQWATFRWLLTWVPGAKIKVAGVSVCLSSGVFSALGVYGCMAPPILDSACSTTEQNCGPRSL